MTSPTGAKYNENNSGPRTDPCGTPYMHVLVDDLQSPSRTYCDRSTMYEWIQFRVEPVRPNDRSRRRSRVLLSTVSKAADRSSWTTAFSIYCRQNSRYRWSAALSPSSGRVDKQTVDD